MSENLGWHVALRSPVIRLISLIYPLISQAFTTNVYNGLGPVLGAGVAAENKILFLHNAIYIYVTVQLYTWISLTNTIIIIISSSIMTQFLPSWSSQSSERGIRGHRNITVHSNKAIRQQSTQTGQGTPREGVEGFTDEAAS